MAQTELTQILEAIQEQTDWLRHWNDLKANQALITFKSSSATNINLLPANPTRKGAVLVNTDANDLWIRYGETATASSGGWTYKIPQNVTWEMPQPLYTGRIDGIWTAAGAGVAEITEW